MYFTGIIIAIMTFFIIGIFHPIVIKTEYYFGTRPWWLFLVTGIVSFVGFFCLDNVILSSIFGVLGPTLLWSMEELFEQKKRVEKGWFPKNPNKK